ncbi:hypothetical protein PRIPAC_98060 [Pristionchus pacificus]|uniref:Uncharacterized protein n=1 Tax=Pristionchus pacificus TaxID=54126 RepID=A0A2A6BJS6_PRIPA|nr:hypothetical protein PRIPAC_98060 [Pristionchus pacificus]|eukprot:PDM66076.1 hypothetical protein PRIPAC_45301 [Pristionchus pacificus]
METESEEREENASQVGKMRALKRKEKGEERKEHTDGMEDEETNGIRRWNGKRWMGMIGVKGRKKEMGTSYEEEWKEESLTCLCAQKR